MIPRAMLVVTYATGRASHAGQVKGDDPDKKEYPGPPGWGSGVRLTLRWLMSYIYGVPILDVSRSHTTTQHSG